MFQNLEIRNFRLFEHLKLDRLGRINLLVGRNNSGKTTLLEALFMLSGAGNPELISRINAFRGFQGFGETATADALQETILKPLFYQFKSNQIITITSHYDSAGPVELTIRFERKNTVDLSLKRYLHGNTSAERSDRLWLPPSTENMWSDNLYLSHKSHKAAHKGHLQISNDGVRVVNSPDNHPFTAATFVHGRSRSPSRDATLLGDLRRRKQGHHLVDALKILEPRLEALEENSIAGYPMIWGDIGLPELVPLSMMGEGMTHVTSIFLAIFATTGGVVMVDEIENGIHYSVLEKVWRAIGEAAERAEVQFFATTHSFECMEAAHDALGDKLAVHRIEEDREGKSRCVTLDAESIAAAIRHGFEVR